MNKLSIFLLHFLLLQAAFTVTAQDSTDSLKTTVKDWVEQRDFVFVAQTAMPMGKTSRHLTSEYTLTVAGDTINSFLPYYGRSYSAPIGAMDGGIKFTSTNSEFTISPKKKSGWDVLIKPKDVPDSYQLRLSVFPNGSASLQVTSNSRQPISFNGVVKEPKKGKEDKK